MDEMDKKVKCICVDVMEDKIAIPVSEYKRLIRCETSLNALIRTHDTFASYDFNAFIKVIKLMHQDLFPPVIKVGDGDE